MHEVEKSGRKRSMNLWRIIEAKEEWIREKSKPMLHRLLDLEFKITKSFENAVSLNNLVNGLEQIYVCELVWKLQTKVTRIQIHEKINMRLKNNFSYNVTLTKILSDTGYFKNKNLIIIHTLSTLFLLPFHLYVKIS